MKMIEYEELNIEHPETTIKTLISIEEAIKDSKALALTKYNFIYPNDEIALLDFIGQRYAKIIEL